MVEETASSSPSAASPSPFSLLLKLTVSVYAFFTLLKPIYITVFDVYSFCFLCAETWKLACAQIEDNEGHRMKLKRGKFKLNMRKNILPVKSILQ